MSHHKPGLLRRSAKWLGYTLVGLVLAVALVVVAFGLVSDWMMDTIYGGSMEPAIPLGSMVLISQVDPEDIQVGDVILYAPPTDTSQRVTHRVVEVIEEESGLMFRTQGDANEDPDTYAVPQENVIGKVRLCIPYLGYFANFVQSKTGFFALLVLPATILIGGALKDILTYSPRKERRAKRLERKQRQQRLARSQPTR